MRPIFSLIYIPLRKPRIERERFELSRKSIRDVEVVPSLQRRSSRWKSKRCGKEEEEDEEAGDGEDQGGPPLQVQHPHHPIQSRQETGRSKVARLSRSNNHIITTAGWSHACQERTNSAQKSRSILRDHFG